MEFLFFQLEGNRAENGGTGQHDGAMQGGNLHHGVNDSARRTLSQPAVMRIFDFCSESRILKCSYAIPYGDVHRQVFASWFLPGKSIMRKVFGRNIDDYGDFLSKSGAALLASASVRSIDKWRKMGLKSTKIDNFVRIKKDDLLNFMESHQQAPSQNQAERPEGWGDG